MKLLTVTFLNPKSDYITSLFKTRRELPITPWMTSTRLKIAYKASYGPAYFSSSSLSIKLVALPPSHIGCLSFLVYLGLPCLSHSRFSIQNPLFPSLCVDHSYLCPGHRWPVPSYLLRCSPWSQRWNRNFSYLLQAWYFQHPFTFHTALHLPLYCLWLVNSTGLGILSLHSGITVSSLVPYTD